MTYITNTAIEVINFVKSKNIEVRCKCLLPVVQIGGPFGAVPCEGM
jgi:hypothetical protein